MSYEHSLAHTKWDCKYHVVFAPKYRRKVFYGQKRYEIGQILRELCNRNRQFWCRGYYVSTVGKQEKVIERYIENQLKEDAMSEELTLNFEDPFTGSKK